MECSGSSLKGIFKGRRNMEQKTSLIHEELICEVLPLLSMWLLLSILFTFGSDIIKLLFFLSLPFFGGAFYGQGTTSKAV